MDNKDSRTVGLEWQPGERGCCAEAVSAVVVGSESVWHSRALTSPAEREAVLPRLGAVGHETDEELAGRGRDIGRIALGGLTQLAREAAVGMERRVQFALAIMDVDAVKRLFGLCRAEG